MQKPNLSQLSFAPNLSAFFNPLKFLESNTIIMPRHSLSSELRFGVFLCLFLDYFSQKLVRNLTLKSEKHLFFRFKTIVEDSVRDFYNFNDKFPKKIPALDTTMYRMILSTILFATERKSSSFKSCWHKCSPSCSTIRKTTSFSLTNEGLGNYSETPLMWSPDYIIRIWNFAN